MQVEGQHKAVESLHMVVQLSFCVQSSCQVHPSPAVVTAGYVVHCDVMLS